MHGQFDSTARFRLATKYMGIVMWDGKLDEWRVVVDLVWSSKRAYGNLGCEIRLRSETNNFRNRNFTVRNIFFPYHSSVTLRGRGHTRPASVGINCTIVEEKKSCT